jgi:hypothetical protein
MIGREQSHHLARWQPALFGDLPLVDRQFVRQCRRGDLDHGYVLALPLAHDAFDSGT